MFSYLGAQPPCTSPIIALRVIDLSFLIPAQVPGKEELSSEKS